MQKIVNFILLNKIPVLVMAVAVVIIGGTLAVWAYVAQPPTSEVSTNKGATSQDVTPQQSDTGKSRKPASKETKKKDGKKQDKKQKTTTKKQSNSTVSDTNGGTTKPKNGGGGSIPPPPPPSSSSCTDPVFVTSDTNGGRSFGAYYVHNNMWNEPSGGFGPETLYACDYDNWYVTSSQTSHGGAVLTYPNVHKDYHDWGTGVEPRIDSFSTITSSFAAQSPHVGIYNVAYDIWVNGVASGGSTEIMIWTENFNQVPAGSKVATKSFGGRTYDVWKTGSSEYIALVPHSPFTSGTLDLLAMMNWIIAQGWMPANSTLGQICFGVEIVSTNGNPATFTFTDFSITDN